MDIATFRERFSPALDEAVKTRVKIFSQTAQDPFLGKIAEHIIELAANGKLLRPYMAHLGYLAGGGAENQPIQDLGIALELFHVFCLVHDDIIDKADTRRSVLTVEAFTDSQLRSNGRWGDLKHLASSQAILVGDLVFAWASRQVSMAAMGSSAPTRVMEEFYGMVDEVVVGQMIDVDTMSRAEHDETLLDRKMYLKTAGYSFVRPLRIGLQLSGNATADRLDALAAIGTPLGLAFQLQDDILDVTSNAETLGKPTLSDIRGGQQTYLTAYVEKRGSEAERSLLHNVMRGLGTDQESLQLRDVFLKGGAVQAAEARAAEFWNQAQAAIEAAVFLGHLQEDFRSLVSILRSRAR